MIWGGIVYRIFATGAVVGVVGVFLAAVSRKREDRIAAMAALSFFVVYTSFHLYVRMNPRVLSFEGELTEQYRDSRVAPPLPTTCAYVFDTGEKKKRTVYWDSFTRNKYDEEIVPPGVKFAIELKLDGWNEEISADKSDAFLKLCSAIKQGLITFGGKTCHQLLKHLMHLKLVASHR